MDPYRKLLILGVNHLVENDLVDLNARDDVEGHVKTQLAGKNTVIIWAGIGFGEIRVSVWWDYDHSQHPQANNQGNSRERFQTSSPLAKRQHYPKFVGAVASGWLEREKGKYLQGVDRGGVFDHYARRGMLDEIKAIPKPSPVGYQATGRVHM